MTPPQFCRKTGNQALALNNEGDQSFVDHLLVNKRTEAFGSVEESLHRAQRPSGLKRMRSCCLQQIPNHGLGPSSPADGLGLKVAVPGLSRQRCRSLGYSSKSSIVPSGFRDNEGKGDVT